MHKAALMGACAASTVALNVAMQQFAWATGGARANAACNSDDDDYPASLLVENMNAQFVALVSHAKGGVGKLATTAATTPSGNGTGSDAGSGSHWDWLVAIPPQSEEAEERWRALVRVSRPTFDYICSLVRDDMEERTTRSGLNVDSILEGREEMSMMTGVEKQVAIALRRLSSGDPLASVGELFGVGGSAVSRATWRFVKAIVSRARHHLTWPEKGEQMERVTSAFEQLTGLRNCCGVLGSKRIRILSSPDEEPGSSAQWLDGAGNVSMVSQAIVDASLRFLDVCIGWPGASGDAVVLQNSSFYRLCTAGERLNGTPEILLGRPVPEYVLGSVEHPLLPWLITPYPQGVFTSDGKFFERIPMQTAFNERLEATRGAVVDRAFLYLRTTWKILDGPNRNPNSRKLSSLVFACCLLHNILLDCGERVDQDQESILAADQSNHYHDVGGGSSPGVYAEQYADSDGWQVRNVLAEYLAVHGGL